MRFVSVSENLAGTIAIGRYDPDDADSDLTYSVLSDHDGYA